MAREPDLFDYSPPARYPERAGFKEGATSREAAERIEPVAATLRGQVLSALRAVYPGGMTADEVAAKLGKSILSIRPRCTELEKVGLIGKTDERRTNDSGMSAAVLRAKGRA